MDAFNFFLRAWMLGGWVFVPTLVIAVVVLREPVRAFWYSLVFSVGGALAFATALLVIVNSRKGDGPLTAMPSSLLGDSLTLLFCAAAAVGGGVLALALLRRLGKTPPGHHS